VDFVLFNELSYYFNAISEELITIEDLKKNKDMSGQVLAQSYEIYRGLLNEENTLDFSSIKDIAYELLRDNEAVRNKIQEQIQYVRLTSIRTIL
jgi:DNA helicase-2/ATP-dependent DNA helicase PcrA